jgi:hypothetical protein
LPTAQHGAPRASQEAITDADALLALDRAAVEHLHYEATIRLGAAKRRRAGLLTTTPTDAGALVEVNGEIAHLGSLVGVLMCRRRTLRIQHRQALGQVPERCEAVTLAVEGILDGYLIQADPGGSGSDQGQGFR